MQVAMCNIRERGILKRAYGELKYPFRRNMGDEELIFLRVLPVAHGFPLFLSSFLFS